LNIILILGGRYATRETRTALEDTQVDEETNLPKRTVGDADVVAIDQASVEVRYGDACFRSVNKRDESVSGLATYASERTRTRLINRRYTLQKCHLRWFKDGVYASSTLSRTFSDHAHVPKSALECLLYNNCN